MYKHLFFFVFTFFSLILKSQNGITGSSDWQIKPVINSGIIILHRLGITNLIKGYPTIYELNIMKPTIGNKLWHLENNKPDLGITFQCIDYKNPSQLGYAFTASPFIEIPLTAKIKPSRLFIRLCIGATYVTKCFDIKENQKNIAIGSHVNAFFQMKWFYQIKISKNFSIEPGIAFTHVSNGRFKNPNLGLNVVSINAGLNYLISSKIPFKENKFDNSTQVKSKNELLFYTALGFNQRSITSELSKSILFSSSFQRNLNNLHKFSLGLDFFYDEIYLMDYQNEFSKKLNGLEQLRISSKLGYSYNVGRISFPIELGYYIFQKNNFDALIVSRVGLRYYSSSGLIGHFGLRTHFAVAYNFEFGLGYRVFI